MSRSVEAPAVLSDGAWVPRGLIRVWRQGPPTPPAEPVDTRPIACPTCRARIDEPCRTKSGRAGNNHAGRALARACACGAPLPTHRHGLTGVRYCESCRVEARRKSWRESTARRRKRAA